MDDIRLERMFNAGRNVPALVYVVERPSGYQYRGFSSAQNPGFLVKSFDISRWGSNLDRMSSLEEGWNGYSAPPPSRAAIVTARDFLSALSSEMLEPSRVAPSAEGGVGITHKKSGRRVYVEFFNNGDVYALFSDNSTMPKSVRVTPYREQFLGLIRRIKEYLDA